jgi:hypothetical protein
VATPSATVPYGPGPRSRLVPYRVGGVNGYARPAGAGFYRPVIDALTLVGDTATIRVHAYEVATLTWSTYVHVACAPG